MKKVMCNFCTLQIRIRKWCKVCDVFLLLLLDRVEQIVYDVIEHMFFGLGFRSVVLSHNL